MFVINGKSSVPGEASDGIVIIYNASGDNKAVNLYDNYGVAQGTWNICINDQNAGIESLGTVTNGQVTVPRKSCMALVKGALVDTDTVYMKNNNVTITLENPRAELIYTKYYTNPYCNNFKVYTYPQLNNSILPNYEALYGKFKNIVSSRYPELQWGVTGE
jgi:hypothetical protein